MSSATVAPERPINMSNNYTKVPPPNEVELKDLNKASKSSTMSKRMSLKKPELKWQKKVFKKMDSAQMQLFLAACLMLSLFMADAWVLGNEPDSHDDILYSILMLIFVIFSFESIILSVVQEGYFLGFFFWMDVLGTFSILLDIGWISDSIVGGGQTAANGSILRATRAAKLGARYGRLMRILKLMKFFQYIPCLNKDGAVQEAEPTMTAVRKVSNALSTVLSQRVAALVMIFVIVVPFLSYTDTDFSVDSWIDAMKYGAKHINQVTTDKENYLEKLVSKVSRFYFYKDMYVYHILLEAPGIIIDKTYSLRQGNLKTSNAIKFLDSYELNEVIYNVQVTLDNSTPNQANAMFGILLILLVIFALFSFSASFQLSVSELVVVPLEKMTNTLRDSATMMLRSMKAMEESDLEGNPKVDDEDEDDGELESQMLEKMVEKLARIVKHVLPNDKNVVDDKNIDSATASWLNDNFAQSHNINENKSLVEDEDQRQARLVKLASLQKVVDPAELNSWNFDVLQYSSVELYEILTYIFMSRNILEEFNVPIEVFKSFLHAIATRYIDSNSYHNFKHGADVCHVSYFLTVSSGLQDALSHLEVFSILVAALSHDVGHPGWNNAYLVKARHELALLHNDRSPLENMHCAVLYDILSKPEFNIFINLNDKQWREVRKIMITIILGTDMSHHFEQISKTQLFYEVNGADTRAFCSGETDTIECFSDDNNRMLIMELILHCSDISNPYKPFALCSKWADLVVEEFCLQGDKEKAQGLEISPMCDRTGIVLCNMQMGFIEFVVAPLLNSFVTIFPPLHKIGTNMMLNYTEWGEKRKVEIGADIKITNKSEECRKLDERIGKFKAKQSYVNELKEFAVRKTALIFQK